MKTYLKPEFAKDRNFLPMTARKSPGKGRPAPGTGPREPGRGVGGGAVCWPCASRDGGGQSRPVRLGLRLRRLRLLSRMRLAQRHLKWIFQVEHTSMNSATFYPEKMLL